MPTTTLGYQFPAGGDAVGNTRDQIEALADSADTIHAAALTLLTPVAFVRGGNQTTTVTTGLTTTPLPLTTGGPGAVNEDATIWSYDSPNGAMVSAVAGLVHVEAMARWSDLTAGSPREISIWRLDSVDATVENHWRDGDGIQNANQAGHGISTWFVINAGDKLQIRVAQTSGVSADVDFAQMRAVLTRNDG